jgi:imidazole glycerol-phosphate synthase
VYVDGPEDERVNGMGFSVIESGEKDKEGRRWVYFACTIKGGRETRLLDVVQLVKAVEAMGCGEILLNAMDRDGSNRGYDLELIRLVKENVTIPVIASSGAGKPEHFEEVFRSTDVDAALGAGMFHRGEWTVGQVKEELGKKGMLVRPFEEFDPDE